MFYTQLLKICEERGEKPSPLLKSLGYSTGFLKSGLKERQLIQKS